MKFMKFAVGMLVLGLCVSAVRLALAAEETPAEPKYSIKDVMKTAHKDGLLKKVLAEEASQEEKLTLLDNYISLIENVPPKGDMESWQNLSGRVALAAAKVAVGREGATAELKAATNCATCHKAHKGE